MSQDICVDFLICTLSEFLFFCPDFIKWHTYLDLCRLNAECREDVDEKEADAGGARKDEEPSFDVVKISDLHVIKKKMKIIK